MELKILKNDLRRNRTISVILLLFIMLSSLLISGAVSIISGLQGSMDNLFVKANALHFLQMHSGELDRDKLKEFAKGNQFVKEYQTIDMQNVEGDKLFWGKEEKSMAESSIDIGFVTQSPNFDYLLDLNNEIINVKNGEIAVPILYQKEYDLVVGDTLLVRDGEYDKAFKIKCFLRDSMMNSTLASSKRLVISEEDLKDISAHTGKREYLIEFQLTETNKCSEFASAYQSAGMPSQGPTIEYSMLRMINMLSDGMVAAVIILVGLLLILIAVLCLRFTILATLEEDRTEIGVMKAIGLAHKDIRQLYLTKYLFFAGFGSIVGYLLAMCFSNVFTQNITLYMGAPKTTIWTLLLPLFAALFVFLIVVLCSRRIINSIRRISALEAMYPERAAKMKKRRGYLSLKYGNFMESNARLALQSLLSSAKTFILLLLLFIICVFLVLVPINLLNTLQSPKFMEYMGVSQSDVRLDMQQNEDLQGQLAAVTDTVKKDSRVNKWAAFATYKCKLQAPDGSVLSMDVESGDFAVFPIDYLSGTWPKQPEEIALSYLWAKELKSEIGDKVELELPDGTKTMMTLCGIYQDITNGGKTAKAILPAMVEQPIRCIVYMKVPEKANINPLCKDYKAAFSSAKVTNIKSFLHQLYGSLIDQTQLVVLLAILISVSMFVLIVSLFLKLLLAKDATQNAIMMSIGFSIKDICKQYYNRILLLLFMGIVIGAVTANTLGQELVSMILSGRGVPKLTFIINPLQVYALIPMLLFLVSAFAVWYGTKSIKSVSISTLNAE